jgi:hypothetical protein
VVATMAVGEIVLFDDKDGDGGFAVKGPRASIVGPDEYLAGSTVVLRYLVRPFEGLPPGVRDERFPLGLTAKNPGYDLVSLYCAGRVLETEPRIATGAPPNDGQGRPIVNLILQYMPGEVAFPEVRTCMRTHSP